MTVTSDELVRRARFLRNAAPPQYQELMAAFAGYTSEQVTALLFATDNLQVAQGHAQQCAKIMKFLQEANDG